MLTRLNDGHCEYPAWYFLHGVVAKTAYDYAALADALNPHPVFGIDATLPLADNIPSMVDHIIAALPSQSDPYYLAGWSAAGILATFVGQRLEEQGKHVHVVMLDSIATEYYQRLSPHDWQASLIGLFEILLNHYVCQSKVSLADYISLPINATETEQIQLIADQVHQLCQNHPAFKTKIDDVQLMITVMTRMLIALIEAPQCPKISHCSMIATRDSIALCGQHPNATTLLFPPDLFSHYQKIDGDHFSIMGQGNLGVLSKVAKILQSIAKPTTVQC